MGVIAEVFIVIAEVITTVVLPVIAEVAIVIAEAVWAAVTFVVEGLVYIAEEVWAGLSWIGGQVAQGYEAIKEAVIEFMYNYTDPIVINVADFVGDLTGPILDVVEILHLREFLQVHLLLNAVWPQYAKAVSSWIEGEYAWLSIFEKAAVQTATYLEFTHATFVLSGAIAGQPFALSELRWMRETAKWMQDAGDEMEKWRLDPGTMMAWVNVHVVEPLVNQVGANQSELYQRLADAHVAITEINERLENVQSALDTWRATAPEEWRHDISAVAQTLRDNIQEWRDTTYLPQIVKLGNDIKDLEVKRKAIRDRIDRPGLLFEGTLQRGAPQQNRQLRAMDAVTAAALRRTQERIKQEKEAMR